MPSNGKYARSFKCNISLITFLIEYTVRPEGNTPSSLKICFCLFIQRNQRSQFVLTSFELIPSELCLGTFGIFIYIYILYILNTLYGSPYSWPNTYLVPVTYLVLTNNCLYLLEHQYTVFFNN